MKASRILAGLSATAIAASMLTMVSVSADSATYEADLGGKTYTGLTNLGYADLTGDNTAVVNSITINGYKFTDSQLSIGKTLTSAEFDNGIASIWSGLGDAAVDSDDGDAYLQFSTDDSVGIQLYVDGAVQTITSVAYEIEATYDCTYKLGFVGWDEVSIAVAGAEGEQPSEGGEEGEGAGYYEIEVDNAATVILLGDAEKGEAGVIADNGITDISYLDVYGVTANISLGDTASAMVENGDWVGGGIGWNSESTSWDSHEFSFQDGAKDITAQPAGDDTYDVVLSGDAPAFAADDTYAQAWIQIWGIDNDYTVNSMTFYGADGNAILYVYSTPAEDDKEVINLYEGAFETGEREDILYISPDELDLYDYEWDGTASLRVTYYKDINRNGFWNVTIQEAVGDIDKFEQEGDYLVNVYTGGDADIIYNEDGTVELDTEYRYVQEDALADVLDDDGNLVEWSAIGDEGVSIGGYLAVITSVDLIIDKDAEPIDPPTPPVVEEHNYELTSDKTAFEVSSGDKLEIAVTLTDDGVPVEGAEILWYFENAVNENNVNVAGDYGYQLTNEDGQSIVPYTVGTPAGDDKGYAMFTDEEGNEYVVDFTITAKKADSESKKDDGNNSGSGNGDSNPATGAAALGTVGILLAGAAMVVSKRKD